MKPAPVYDVDLFSDAFIEQPNAHYRAIRDAGPAVWLPQNEVWAVGRFADVRQVLREHQMFSSAHGVAANDVVNDRSRGTTIASDPPAHTKMRAIIREPLTSTALKPVRARLEAEADALIEQLLERGSFDAIADFARHLPMSIVSNLVGLPEDGRSNMLRWAAATFDALGSLNARGTAALPEIDALRAFCQDPATIAGLRPDGWAAAIWKAAERGTIETAQCPAMMRDYIAPSLDTTIFAIGSLIWLFGNHPEQWDLLRNDATLLPAAINEGLRLESPIRCFTRYVVADCDIDGVELSAGSRVIVLYGSANRDERKWDRPDVFDIRRDAREQLGFGTGQHICAGMHLARLEMTVLFTSFARRVERFEVAAPVWAKNNLLHGLSALTVTLKQR